MGLKEAYEEKVEAQVKEWEARVDLVKAKAAQAQAETKIRYEEQLANLQKKKEVMAQRLAAIREAGEEKWEELRTGVEAAWEDMKKYLEEIVGDERD